MFCLEIEKQDDEVIPLVFNQYLSGTCNCRIYTHVGCWIHYTTHKGHVECPICHTIIQQQPSAPAYIPPPLPGQPIQIVIDNQVYQYRLSPVAASNEIVYVQPVCTKPRRIAFLFALLVIGFILLYFLRR